jgi:REP element-mobilizing transposase RayT
MPKNLKRRYGQKDLHFITCSCYRRLPLFRSVRARNVFVRILDEMREQYGFAVVGYVIMPEHVHLLISEPSKNTPSTAMQVLKQRVSRELRQRKRRMVSGQRELPFSQVAAPPAPRHPISPSSELGRRDWPRLHAHGLGSMRF